MVGATSERLRLRLQETKCGGGDGKEGRTMVMMAIIQREKEEGRDALSMNICVRVFVLFCFGSGL